MRIEEIILTNLLFNRDFATITLPFLKEEYFNSPADKLVFNEVTQYTKKYKSLPSKEALIISIGEKKGIPEEVFKEAVVMINDAEPKPDTNEKWLKDSTEKFCQDMAIYNAIKKSVNILDGSDASFDRGYIPQLLSEALGVNFDINIGHNYIEDFENRFNDYHVNRKRIPFDLDILNLITGGGFLEKTLNLFMAGPKVGKSLVMCHLASSYLLQGFDVLYITLEMAEERIAERIDANLLDINIGDISKVKKEIFEDRINQLKLKTTGRLVIKEYPTSSASVTHFRSLLNDLELKKGFKPQVIIIDYLNICASSRIKLGAGNANSYTYVKSIAEELRALAVEKEVPIISATQINRSGFNSGDPGMDSTSESFGVPATVDFMCAIVSNEELAKLGQFIFIQLASRYGDPNYYKRFVVGVDKKKMRLYNAEDSSQVGIQDSGQPAKTKREKFGTLKV